MPVLSFGSRRSSVSRSDGSGPLGSWREELGRAVQRSLVLSTRRATYNETIQNFTDRGWATAWPMTSAAVMHYAVDLHDTGLRPATIANMLAAISFT